MNEDVFLVTTDNIDINIVHEKLYDPKFGAQLIFLGVVRDNNEGKDVNAVSYEAFNELADRTFKDIANEARELVGDRLKIIIAHKVGTLSIGEVSTVIGVASPHRAECYKVSRYIIEQLKIRAPVWKEEHYGDGNSEWLDGTKLNT
jgi:molybdopterin synthase catalytic subunit